MFVQLIYKLNFKFKYLSNNKIKRINHQAIIVYLYKMITTCKFQRQTQDEKRLSNDTKEFNLQGEYLQIKKKLDRIFVPSSLNLCIQSIPLVNYLIQVIQSQMNKKGSGYFKSKKLSKQEPTSEQPYYISIKSNQIKQNLPTQLLIQHLTSLQQQNNRLSHDLLIKKSQCQELKFLKTKRAIVKSHNINQQNQLYLVLKKRQNQLFSELQGLKFKYNQLMDLIHEAPQDIIKDKMYIKRLIKHKSYQLPQFIVKRQNWQNDRYTQGIGLQINKQNLQRNTRTINYNKSKQKTAKLPQYQQNRQSKNLSLKLSILEGQIDLLNKKIILRDQQIQRLQSKYQSTSLLQQIDSLKHISKQIVFNHYLSKKNNKIKQLEERIDVILDIKSESRQKRQAVKQKTEIEITKCKSKNQIKKNITKDIYQAQKKQKTSHHDIQSKYKYLIRAKSMSSIEAITQWTQIKQQNDKQNQDYQQALPLKPMIIVNKPQKHQSHRQNILINNINKQQFQHSCKFIQLPKVKSPNKYKDFIMDPKIKKKKKQIFLHQNSVFIEQLKSQIRKQFEIERISLLSDKDLLQRQCKSLQTTDKLKLSEIMQLKALIKKYQEQISQKNNRQTNRIKFINLQNIKSPPKSQKAQTTISSKLNSPLSSRNKPINSSEYSNSNVNSNFNSRKSKHEMQIQLNKQKIISNNQYFSQGSSVANPIQTLRSKQKQFKQKQISVLSGQKDMKQKYVLKLSEQNKLLHYQIRKLQKTISKLTQQVKLMKKQNLKLNEDNNLLNKNIQRLQKSCQNSLINNKKSIKQKTSPTKRLSSPQSIVRKSKIQTAQKESSNQTLKNEQLNIQIKQMINTLSDKQQQNITIKSACNKYKTLSQHLQSQLKLKIRQIQMHQSMKVLFSSSSHAQLPHSQIIKQLHEQIKKLQIKYQEVIQQNKHLIKGSFELQNENQELKMMLENKQTRILELIRQVQILRRQCERIQSSIREEFVKGENIQITEINIKKKVVSQQYS